MRCPPSFDPPEASGLRKEHVAERRRDERAGRRGHLEQLPLLGDGLAAIHQGIVLGGQVGDGLDQLRPPEGSPGIGALR